MRRAIECTKNVWTDLLIYGTSKEAERWQDGMAVLLTKWLLESSPHLCM